MISDALPLAGRYLEAQLRGDRSEALRLVMVEGLERGVSVPELYLRVVQPAQEELGRLWQENQISVAQEHLATGISQLVLASLYPRLPRRASNGRSVIVACIEGETHELGARMAADFLEMDGFRVRFLGADVPTSDLLRMLRTQPPDLLTLSITLSTHLETLQETVHAARAVLPRLPIAIGGAGIEWRPALLQELQLLRLGRTAPECVRTVRGLLGLEAHAG